MLSVSSKKTAPDPTDTGEPLYAWGIPKAVLLVLGSFILLPILAQIVVSFVPYVLGWDTLRAEQWLDGSFGTFFKVLLAEALIAGTLFWFVRRKRQSFLKVVALERLHWKDVGYALTGAMVYIGMFIIAVTLINALVPLDTTKEQAIGFEKTIEGFDLALAFISLAILPPIIEEIVFRGFLFGTLRARKVALVSAMVSTSIFFGMLHLLGSGDGSLLWIAFIDTFVLSMVLCYIRESTGSIWGCIFLHALKNTFVFINLFIISST
jgi:membrane protease YdiL (CAAX protease family)